MASERCSPDLPLTSRRSPPGLLDRLQDAPRRLQELPRGPQDSSKRPPVAFWTLYMIQMAFGTRFCTVLDLNLSPRDLKNHLKNRTTTMKINDSAHLSIFCSRALWRSIWKPLGPHVGGLLASKRPLKWSKRAPRGFQERPKRLPIATQKPLEAPP